MPPMTIQKPSALHLSLVVILAIIWGSSFTMIKFSVEGFTPIGTAFGRISIGFCVLLPYALYRGWCWPKGVNQWLLVVVIALFGNTLPFLMIAWAETKINAGLTSLILSTSPFFALGLSHFLTTDDKINRFKSLGLCLSFSGLLLALLPDVEISNISTLSAIFAVLGSAFCYAIGGIALRFVNDIAPTGLSCLTLGLSSLMLLPVAATSWTAITANPRQSAYLAIIYLGLIPTGIATIMRFYLIPRVGITWFSQSLNLIPIFGILFGAFILHETITYNLLLSLVIVLAGLGVSKITPQNPQNKANNN